MNEGYETVNKNTHKHFNDNMKDNYRNKQFHTAHIWLQWTMNECKNHLCTILQIYETRLERI